MERAIKIKSFTDLYAWKEAHKLVIEIYNVTKTFSREEMYAIIDQMRRCSVSISSNIAEGFSRQSKKEKIQFYSTSKGSLTELQNHLLVSRDVGYLSNNNFTAIANQTIVVHKLLNGLIKSANNK